MLTEEIYNSAPRVTYKKPNAVDRLKRDIKFGIGVEAELANNREMTSLLHETIAQLKRYFPANAEYTLEKSLDPSDSCLILEIWSRCDATKALELLYKFDDEWWLDNMLRSVEGGLIIEVHGR